MKFFKSFLFWFVIILFLELVFNLFSYETFLLGTLGNIIVFSSLFSVFISILCGFLNKSDVIRYILLFIFGFYFSLQFIFHDVFLSYFSFSMLGLSDQLTSFVSETFGAIFGNIHIVLLFFLPFILSIIFRKKIVFEKFKYLDYVYNLLVFAIIFLIFIINLEINKNVSNSVYDLLFNINENSLNIEKMGVLPSSFIDIKRTIFGFENEIVMEEPDEIPDEEVSEEYGYNVLDLNFSDSSNKNIQQINNYIKSLSGTQKNEYTGMFEGYNLIYITAESFSHLGIREDLTPTLYKLVNSGFIFTNFYTPNNTSTLGGEFQSVTGLFANGTALPQWRKGTNSFLYGLATVFKEKNYNTFAYHNHNYAFQNRDKYLKSLGFDNYKGCYNGMEKLINCKLWPESDYEMMSATISEYADNQPFLAYYMTVSGHLEYNFSGNAMAKKHKDKVKNLDYSTEAKAYLATQIELDLALEHLIKTLEEKGILDKTVIVMQADHYPYKLSLNDINSLSTYKRDSVVEVNHNSLIIWNPNIETTIIDKVCMSIDTIPTVYNLFGIDYDSRLFVGNDILSNKDGLAIFANRSWVTEYGTYYANSSKFVSNGKEVPEGYVEKINNIVNNRLNISKMIIANDYYSYVSEN